MNRILTILILFLSLRAVAGEQATAEATLTAGFVTGITVTFGGSGYTSEPAVTISGGGGTGAVAKAILNGDKVALVIVLNAGSGYTGISVVTIEPPPKVLGLGVRLVPEITVYGPPGEIGQVEWSPTLGTGAVWQVLTNVTLGSEGVALVDLAAANSKRFYRVISWISPPEGMALIPAGPFQMGDSFGEGNLERELPVHTVTVSEFYIDKHEVTKALWDDVKDWSSRNGYGFDNAGEGNAANHPVRQVNWYDVVKWCNARSQKAGLVPAYYTDLTLTQVYKSGQVAPFVKWNSGYRLPTEAEWEKAARGGVLGHRFPWSDAETITHSRANYYSEDRKVYDVSPTRLYHPKYGNSTSPVGSFAANGYGLYDMAGNVWEWCWDWFGGYSSEPQTDPHGPDLTLGFGPNRMLRGGSWGGAADSCRSADRTTVAPGNRNNPGSGFRSVLRPGQ